MTQKVNLAAKLSQFTELWSPKTVTQFTGTFFESSLTSGLHLTTRAEDMRWLRSLPDHAE